MRRPRPTESTHVETGVVTQEFWLIPEPEYSGSIASVGHGRQSFPEREHTCRCAQRFGAHVFLDMDLVLPGFKNPREIPEIIHRHPRAMGAAHTGSAMPYRRRLHQDLARRGLLHLVENAVVGGDDEFLIGQILRRLNQLRGRAHDISQFEHRRR